MSVVRISEAEWKGDLMSGEGVIKLGSKAYEGPYSFKSRTAESSPQTNPEELIGAALAGCFSMQLSALLTKAGHPPESIHSTAKVHMSMDANGISVSEIDLETEAKVPGMNSDEFTKTAETAKTICPISKALSALKINFKAVLL
ncbi:MAG: OsmC family peroxiredoxin [Gammaproteobacteria bacterium]|nr:OsmC family peroxiredoxin [Gammaproteobacteria bacterium]